MQVHTKQIIFRDQSNLLYSYSLRKTVQRAFSLPTLGELERELLLELAMVVLINVGMSLYETSQVCLTKKKHTHTILPDALVT